MDWQCGSSSRAALRVEVLSSNSSTANKDNRKGAKFRVFFWGYKTTNITDTEANTLFSFV
jgi:hypothetical protein